MAQDRDATPPPPPPPVGPTVSLWERWPSRRILLLTLTLLLVDVMVQVLAFATMERLFPAAAAGAVVMLLLLRGLIRLHGRGETTRSFCAWRCLRRSAAAGVVLVAAGCWYVVSLLSTWSASLHPPSPEFVALLERQIPRSPFDLVVAVVAVVLVVPVAEEVLFRGILYRLCRRWWSPAGSAALTGLVFGLLHGEPWYLFGLVALGVLLAVVFELAGTLAAPWLLHACYNAVSLGMMMAYPDTLATVDAPPRIDVALLAASLAALGTGFLLLQRAGPAGSVPPPPVRPAESADVPRP